MKAGERWTYRPPAAHTVCWVAVHEGRLRTPDTVPAGALTVFESSNEPIELVAPRFAGDVSGNTVRYSQLVGAGMVQTPPMHCAGARQPGPFVASQFAKSAAGATQEEPDVGHVPLAEQVVSKPLIRPHGWPAATTAICMQTPLVALVQ